MRGKLFRLHRIVVIYTKEPGKEAAEEPIVCRDGVTVSDLAKMIHNDFYDRFIHHLRLPRLM